MVIRYQIILCLAVLSVASAQMKEEDIDSAIDWINSFLLKNDTSSATGSNGSTQGTGAVESRDRICLKQDKTGGICVKPEECNNTKPELEPTDLVELRDKSSCHYLQICCSADDVTQIKKGKKIKRTPGCGWSNPGAHVFRTKPRTYADFGDFPWMVALLTKDGTEKAFLGGGTLIHPSVVITVAHKVVQLTPQKLTCRAGEWDTQTEEEMYPYQDRDVKELVIHDEFNKSLNNFLNDIALLITTQPFDLDEAPHIGVACLSTVQLAPGTRCFSMGWGKDFFGSDKYANILKKIEMPLVNPAECYNAYQLPRLGDETGSTLHPSLTCAGGDESTLVGEGDGGSSLVCYISAPNEMPRYAVVGLVAVQGRSNIDKNRKLPGLYTSIPHLLPWINKQMESHGVQDNSYIFNRFQLRTKT